MDTCTAGQVQPAKWGSLQRGRLGGAPFSYVTSARLGLAPFGGRGRQGSGDRHRAAVGKACARGHVGWASTAEGEGWETSK